MDTIVEHVLGVVDIRNTFTYQVWAYDNGGDEHKAYQAHPNAVDIFVQASSETEALNKAKSMVKRDVYKLLSVEELCAK